MLHLIKFFSTLYFYQQIVSIYLLNLGLNYLQINSIWGIIVITQAAAEIPTGILSDRFGRKITICAALILQLVGEVIFIFGTRYAHFVICAMAGGIGFALLSGCFDALMYDSLLSLGREDEMQKAIGLNTGLGLLAAVIGSVSGGFITASLQVPQIRLAIIFTAISVGLSVVIAFFLKEVAPDGTEAPKSSTEILKKAVTTLLKSRNLRRISLLIVFAAPFINYLLNFYPPYFAANGVPGAWFGVTLSLGSLGGFFVAKNAHRIEAKLGVRVTTLAATLTPALLYVLLSITGRPWTSVVLVVAAIATMQLQRPVLIDYVNRHLQSSIRATALSIISAVSGIYVAAMGALIGLAAEKSIQTAFLLMATAITVASTFFTIGRHHTLPPKKMPPE